TKYCICMNILNCRVLNSIEKSCLCLTSRFLVSHLKSVPNIEMVYMDIFSTKFDTWLKEVTKNVLGIFVGKSTGQGFLRSSRNSFVWRFEYPFHSKIQSNKQH